MKIRIFFFLMIVWGVVASSAAVTDDLVILSYHDVRDDVRGVIDPDQNAISTENLVGHFDWLKAHDYAVVSLQQVIDARENGKPLPPRAVLLSFDDGLISIYTHVFPLLKAYHYPAIVAVVGHWMELPKGESVPYDPKPLGQDRFATWAQLREMARSGLVEIASHSDNLHRGVPGNPHGNFFPSATTHVYDSETKTYESDEHYRERISLDLQRSVAEIREKTGFSPRAMVWPYGAHNKLTEQLAKELGMKVSLVLDAKKRLRVGNPGLQGLERAMIVSNRSVSDLSYLLRNPNTPPNVRAIQVDLDYIYSADPAELERNLSLLIERVRRLGATQVWLQAFADPDGDDVADAVYFPNRHMPMRADIFSRVAWQLRTRADVIVFAWMPVLAWKLPDADQQHRLEIRPLAGKPKEKGTRLNPFLPESQRIIGDLYEDLTHCAPIAGILFHDDAVLRDTDNLGTHTGLSAPKRTRALIDFTKNLEERAAMWQPQLLTARNLFSRPLMEPQSEGWFAQSFLEFIGAYDEVALMAMPYMEDASSPEDWLQELAATVQAVPQGMEATVFELQTMDWRKSPAQPIPSEKLAAQMRFLQIAGARHLAYYPDDFVAGHPDADVLRKVFSVSTFPHLPR